MKITKKNRDHILHQKTTQLGGTNENHSHKTKKTLKSSRTSKKRTTKKRTSKKRTTKITQPRTTRKSKKFEVKIVPKINFPYVYYNLSFSVFHKYKDVLNPYFWSQSNLKTQTEKELYLKNENELCVLVLKFDIMTRLLDNPDLLNNSLILNQILGHAKLIFHQEKKEVEIKNFQTHDYDVEFVNNQIKTNKKTVEFDDGSVLINIITTSIIYYKAPFSILNITHNLSFNENNYEMLLLLFTSIGFKSVYVLYENKKLSTDIKELFIKLSKPLYDYVNTEFEYIFPYYETLDISRQIALSLNEGFCI
jgi:hypothetical protein